MAKVIIIESIYNGTDVYVSEGELVKQMFAPAPGIAPQPNMSDNRFFEGWKHENWDKDKFANYFGVWIQP